MSATPIQFFPGAVPTEARRLGRKNFRPWYDDIIDWMLTHPGGTHIECAKHFNRNPVTISQITASDVFRARLAQRRNEMNTMLAEELVSATSSVALNALNEVNRRVRDNPAAIPTGLLSNIATTALDRLGYGQKPLAPVASNPTQVNVSVSVSSDVLAEAQRKMREVQTLNATAVEVPPLPILPGLETT